MPHVSNAPGTAPSVLVTGGAGFIGSHLVDRLLEEGWWVTVVDNFDPFYDEAIKRANVAPHHKHERYRLLEADIRDDAALRAGLPGGYDVVVHLAAKAGVRPSIEHPVAYQEVNVRGTQHLLELAHEWGTPQFVFASSSSVYGVNPDVPWSEEDHVLLPISPYASTKVSGELLGHVYSHLYGIRFLGLRFFTVYGPRQRPDLAIAKFARLIEQDSPISLYGDGSTRRDYTYVADIVDGIVRAMAYQGSNYEIINLGSGNPITLIDMVETVETEMGAEPDRIYAEEQAGDVPQTWADISKAQRLLGYSPTISLTEGVRQFLAGASQHSALKA